MCGKNGRDIQVYRFGAADFDGMTARRNIAFFLLCENTFAFLLPRYSQQFVLFSQVATVCVVLKSQQFALFYQITMVGSFSFNSQQFATFLSIHNSLQHFTQFTTVCSISLSTHNGLQRVSTIHNSLRFLCTEH